ncbi:hypothetical protein HCK00_18730 [Streptomyces sp. PLAI1-29]|uniref:DUF2690 domain-containing protein n=1 Tax=Streptomyces zingiberis TaxID=2053010 RepID=A0ABX1BXZ0_9ACTN|nr:hypothetical protein [Streptomyces zingiberis]
MAATCLAATALGTGVASAGSGPAPAPGGAPEGAAGSESGNPASARAQASGVCEDAHQIGSTAYIYRNGETIASVKQFYSPGCDENYGYAWVWKSFLDQDLRFDLTVGVWSYDREYLVGAHRAFDTHEQEFWGNPADTVAECTAAEGALSLAGEEGPYSARSSKRC